jgi:hypothetical protein
MEQVRRCRHGSRCRGTEIGSAASGTTVGLEGVHERVAGGGGTGQGELQTGLMLAEDRGKGG